MIQRALSTLRLGLLVLTLSCIAPAAFAQGSGGSSGGISSEDISDEEIDAAAEIIVAMQMQRQELRTQMREEYGNAQEMDSTQRRTARQELMRERQALMQRKAEEEDLSAQRLGRLMQSARRDSTLRTRIRTAVQEKRQERMESDQDDNEDESGSDESGGL
jgi:hypothetical protein